MVLPKAQIEDSASATIVRAQMHLQELQVVDVDRICKQVGTVTVAEVQIRSGIASFVLKKVLLPLCALLLPLCSYLLGKLTVIRTHHVIMRA